MKHKETKVGSAGEITPKHPWKPTSAHWTAFQTLLRDLVLYV